MNTVMNAIEAAGLTKSFPRDYKVTSWLKRFGKPPARETVLREIDLSIAKGEIFGLLGPNGAGKTTLLKMLATLLLPDFGSIRIAGFDALTEPIEVKRRIGLSMSDERSFYFRLSARENLQYFGDLAEVRPNKLGKRIVDVLEIVDLGDAIDRHVKGYSSGMRQRLAVARALLADPEIVLLDEPTRAVDPLHAMHLRTLIRDTLAGTLGKTVVLTTNVLEEAWSTCDRVGILSAGRLAAIGPPALLAAHYGQRRRFGITFDSIDRALVQDLERGPGVERVEIRPSPQGDVAIVTLLLHEQNLAEFMALVSAQRHAVLGFRELDDALFDVFRATTIEART